MEKLDLSYTADGNVNRVCSLENNLAILKKCVCVCVCVFLLSMVDLHDYLWLKTLVLKLWKVINESWQPFDKSTDYTEMYDSFVFSLNFYLSERGGCSEFHISF